MARALSALKPEPPNLPERWRRGRWRREGRGKGVAQTEPGESRVIPSGGRDSHRIVSFSKSVSVSPVVLPDIEFLWVIHVVVAKIWVERDVLVLGVIVVDAAGDTADTIGQHLHGSRYTGQHGMT